jgi:undecaprenyl-diphosphatase
MTLRDDGAPTGKRGVASPSRRFELKSIATVAAIAGALIGLVVLTSLVVGGSTTAFDHRLLLSLREAGNPNDPLGAPWFEEMVRDVSALGSTVVLTLAVAIGATYLLLIKAPQKAAFLLIACVVGTSINRLLKVVFGRERPDLVAHETLTSGASYPSGHSANSAIIYLLLGMMLARVEDSYAAKAYIFLVCVLITLLVGLSRIYLGVHWPTDVIAGWALGAVWALLCWMVLINLQPSGTRR